MSGSLESVLRSISLKCSVEQAFRAWTTHIDIWWPVARISASREPSARVVLEPREGGRIYERTDAGDEHDWARIVRFEPSTCLTFAWFLGADPAKASEVEVRFIAEDDGTTTVVVDHRKWEQADPSVAAVHRACVAAPDGWTGILHDYQRAVDAWRQGH